MKCWVGKGGADLFIPHWKVGTSSTCGQGASEQFEHGGNTVRLVFSEASCGIGEDGFEGVKIWGQEALKESW